MKTVFVDSNLFLRFFLGDDKSQHKSVVRLFRKASTGKVRLITGPPVFLELAWTLASAYKLPSAQILDVLSGMATLPGLRLTDADLIERTLLIAKHYKRDFADAYIVASAEKAGVDEIATFNRKHFQKMSVPLCKL